MLFHKILLLKYYSAFNSLLIFLIFVVICKNVLVDELILRHQYKLIVLNFNSDPDIINIKIKAKVY
jgi:hypothetical protein